MAETASFPQVPQSINQSSYSRTLSQIGEEVRGEHAAEEDSTDSESEEESTSTSESSSEDSDSSEQQECAEPPPCPEKSQAELAQIQKKQAWLRDGSRKGLSDVSSVRSKPTVAKRRPHAPGLLEQLLLPRTTAARVSALQKRSATDVKPKPLSAAESTTAPSVKSQKSASTVPKDKPKPTAQVVKVQCITCLDDVPIRRSAKLECDHRMCHSCLKRVFVLSTTDPQLMPPKCCTENAIPLRHVDNLFDSKFKRLWNRKHDECATKDRLYCPKKGCGLWIKPKHIEMDRATGRRVGTCKECKTKVCRKCGLRWHGNRPCGGDDGTKSVLELGKEQGWKRCYSCRAMVQLAEGCNHMRCRCNAEFCMVCGSKWKTCDCPWFNLPPEILRVEDFLIPGDFPQNTNGVPPPPPAFRDRRDMPFDPLNVPDIFRPRDLNQPRPLRPRIRRNRTDLVTQEEESREEQEAADEALARQLQDQELGADLHSIQELAPDDDDPVIRARQRIARRARRRVFATTEDSHIYEVDERSVSPQREESAGREAAMAGLEGRAPGQSRVEMWRRQIQE